MMQLKFDEPESGSYLLETALGLGIVALPLLVLSFDIASILYARFALKATVGATMRCAYTIGASDESACPVWVSPSEPVELYNVYRAPYDVAEYAIPFRLSGPVVYPERVAAVDLFPLESINFRYRTKGSTLEIPGYTAALHSSATVVSLPSVEWRQLPGGAPGQGNPGPFQWPRLSSGSSVDTLAMRQQSRGQYFGVTDYFSVPTFDGMSMPSDCVTETVSERPHYRDASPGCESGFESERVGVVVTGQSSRTNQPNGLVASTIRYSIWRRKKGRPSHLYLKDVGARECSVPDGLGAGPCNFYPDGFNTVGGLPNGADQHIKNSISLPRGYEYQLRFSISKNSGLSYQPHSIRIVHPRYRKVDIETPCSHPLTSCQLKTIEDCKPSLPLSPSLHSSSSLQLTGKSQTPLFSEFLGCLSGSERQTKVNSMDIPCPESARWRASSQASCGSEEQSVISTSIPCPQQKDVPFGLRNYGVKDPSENGIIKNTTPEAMQICPIPDELLGSVESESIYWTEQSKSIVPTRTLLYFPNTCQDKPLHSFLPTPFNLFKKSSIHSVTDKSRFKLRPRRQTNKESCQSFGNHEIAYCKGDERFSELDICQHFAHTTADPGCRGFDEVREVVRAGIDDRFSVSFESPVRIGYTALTTQPDMCMDFKISSQAPQKIASRVTEEAVSDLCYTLENGSVPSGCRSEFAGWRKRSDKVLDNRISTLEHYAENQLERLFPSMVTSTVSAPSFRVIELVEDSLPMVSVQGEIVAPGILLPLHFRKITIESKRLREVAYTGAAY